ncbi:MAG: hypothetical protein MJ239_00810 [Bacilli bacterium]|nr:hypothetical protein [Bacilli bacterium]
MYRIFKEYASLFAANGYHLYMIGGTSRDYLLSIEPSDFDFVTDATPEEEKAFLKDADYTFAKFGSVKVFNDGVEVDITTFREEGDYKDFRHPGYIRFVKDMSKDVVRRDFTVNALYIDIEGKVYDLVNGIEDLNKKVIRFIGDPYKRIEEDPLRIIRAERFAKRLGFQMEKETEKAIEEKRGLLEKLNPDKVKMELLKE